MFLDSPAEPPQQNLLMNHVSEEVKLPLETSVEKTSINKLSIPEDQKPLQMRDSVTPPLESGRSSKMSNKPPKYPSQISNLSLPKKQSKSKKKYTKMALEE
mmetsp:Transcript_29976/g.29499  ORF Transcript_29976/g.29499 Transcript_29976/m.29499 type:complete len:101 (+) Transcript_29976:708-1010(+)